MTLGFQHAFPQLLKVTKDRLQLKGVAIPRPSWETQTACNHKVNIHIVPGLPHQGPDAVIVSQ